MLVTVSSVVSPEKANFTYCSFGDNLLFYLLKDKRVRNRPFRLKLGKDEKKKKKYLLFLFLFFFQNPYLVFLRWK
jgi:hypothetical protein